MAIAVVGYVLASNQKRELQNRLLAAAAWIGRWASKHLEVSEDFLSLRNECEVPGASGNVTFLHTTFMYMYI